MNKLLMSLVMVAILVGNAYADAELAGGVCTSSLINEDAARSECQELLAPDTPHFSLSLPGGVFVGGLFLSSKAKNVLFLLAPQVSVSGGASVPLKRPEAVFVGLADAKRSYRLPKGRNVASALLFAINGSLSGGLAWGDKDNGVSGNIGSGGAAGLVFAYQRYWVWFSKDGTETGRVGFSLGAVVGYMNTNVVGDTMLIAIQPTFVIAGG